EDINEIIKSYWKENNINSSITEFSEQLAKGTADNLEKIDDYIKKVSEHWAIDRMGVIDRNLLRMAVQELLFMEDIPLNVTIDEAIEIAKKFGTDDSANFVNGVLDKIKNDLEKAAE
ncbi:MAG: transcription antitermination factor NusB, partial [Nitrospinota bacterium]|nr:transcription antitermination factor NusB [Nitrospinota bacterium]